MRVATAVLEKGELKTHVMPVDFAAWMAAEHKRIYLLCLHLLRNNDEADSATQDVFVEAYRALERLDGQAIQEPAKWLTRVALNTGIDRLRSKRWRFDTRRRLRCPENYSPLKDARSMRAWNRILESHE